MDDFKKIFAGVLKKVEPPVSEMFEIKEYLEKFIDRFEKRCREKKIKAEIFVGGSFAKKTMIKKDLYDVDVFVRFDVKYSAEKRDISEMTRKILEANQEKYTEVYGSRIYFRIKAVGNFSLEIIPVIKIKMAKESENITDLSYSHVKYITKKIRDKKLLDEIKITKAFCYACNSYGAESYIKGFSGYAIELLIFHFKSFLNFVKTVARADGNEKIIIDTEKFYKNKNEILINLNEAKTQSPVILIDPTYKQRNACAALSEETFEKFKTCCRQFLKNPSLSWFEMQIIDLEKIKKKTIQNKNEFCLVELKTERQEGDIAGTKLLKFYEHLSYETGKYFLVKDRGFSYDGRHSAKAFFVVKSKKEIIFPGPNLKDKKNARAFKHAHKKTFAKSGKFFAKEPVRFSLNEFFENWKIKNQMKMLEMDVSGFIVYK